MISQRCIPLSASFFLWRLIQDWILVEMRLKIKGFQFASKCQCCNSEETLLHVMWDNSVAKQRNDAKHRSLGMYPNRVIWQILKLIRQLFHGRQFQRWQWRGDIQIAQMWGLTFPRKVLSLPKIISWHKPLTGEFKLNVDGSFINNFQNAVGGGLLRDHIGSPTSIGKVIK
ncbi:Uncharacterized protein TCM_028258 [Theobroma cacao]|uniref:Reverse transcriptase zinc-binding domain-containing protein n=1 Tax=Theobroma cacao TaxID=3641 RepID=A0A061GAN5_THECC|nr:Uncharacterized protein TCM_028258 [Theobroma cacao]